MKKKKKTGHIKQKKQKRQSKQARQTKQLQQSKTASQNKPAQQSKQANQTKQNKPAQQSKQTKQDKPAQQSKETKQNKPAQQHKPTQQSKPAEQKQRKNNAQRGKNVAGQKRNHIKHRGQWKEVLYNCPYVLGIVLTSLIVLLWSDEIGFKAVAREAQMVMAQVGMTGERATDRLSVSDIAFSGKKQRKEDVNSDVMENNSENDEQQEGNAGERKENDGEKTIGNEPKTDRHNNEMPENMENVEETVKGVTNFESYEPQEIDSRYYSDAGKVALTTEYPYTKENISYFSDAAFLGDSRTLGISDYAGLEEADFYCDSGMMIFKLLEEKVTYQKTGDKVDLTQVLQEKQYGKIYIMLGMNELGYGNTETYLEEYRKVVSQIKEWQPQAVIYIMANLHVSREKNNMATEFNNININDKNAASAQLANGTDIFYLDANPLFTDQDGFLNAELTFDGVHLYAQHYDKWREFLLEHAVEPLKGAEEQEG